MAPGAPASEPALPPDRSRRIYVYWAVGLAFLTALALFCWLVAGPVLEAKRAVRSCLEPPSNLISREVATPTVERLGGQSRAARKLALYLRTPEWACRKSEAEREYAALLLGHCGRWGLARVIPMLRGNDRHDRRAMHQGVLAMCAFFERPTWWDVPVKGPEREKALGGLDSETRALAEEALSALMTARDVVGRGGR